MKIIGTFFFYVFIVLTGIMPFFILYAFADFLRFIMANVVKYRKKVIENNLLLAFPGLSQKELNKLSKQVYKNLVDNILEGIKTFTLSKKSVVKRHKITNPELLEEFYKQGRSIIGVTAHYNNWEWGSLSASLQTDYNVAALYKPLSNKHIDKQVRKSRSRCGTELVPIYETSNTFEKYKGKPYIYLMAADQSPSGRELPKAFWVDFLGINTPFLHGMEKHARNNDYAVVYIDIQRVKRGFYEVELSLLSDNPNSPEPGKLTQAYANKLETIIKAKPQNWLWSHKRWKHNKQ